MSQAFAQTCTPIGDFPNPGGRNEYRINVNQFTSHLGLGASAVRHLVGLGHATWNQSGRTGYFVHTGSTNVTGDDEAAFCATSGDWGLVTMAETDLCTSTGARGYAAPQCAGTRWHVNICPDFDWSAVGTPGAGQIDVGQTLAHEFGHVLDLPHPSGTVCGTVFAEGATMCPTAYSDQRTRQRDLYPWDIECSWEVGARDVSVEVITQSSGTFLSPIDVPPATATKGHPNVRFSSGLDTTRVLQIEHTSPDQMRMYTYPAMVGMTPLQSLSAGKRAHAPSATWWPERPDEIQHYHHRAYGPASWMRPYVPMQTRYPHDLSGPGTLDWLTYCVGTPSWCASANLVQTDHRLAHAYDDAAGRSVTAWVHKNRQDDSLDRRMLISPGVFPGIPNRLWPPEITDIRSSIPPAVACKAGEAAEGYDCMLAYVDFDSADGLIRHRFFSVGPGWTFTWRPHEFVTVHRTSQGVALWYQDGWWWRAQVHAVTQDIHVYRSTDGLGWSMHTDLGFSVQVPAVAAHYTGFANFVFLTR